MSHIALARQIRKEWTEMHQETPTLEEAKLGLVGRFGEALGPWTRGTTTVQMAWGTPSCTGYAGPRALIGSG